ncbi:MAG: hypothetical protein AMXMBFR4_00010 [Candidatus Hydrogenedentota bacterium]
MRGKCPLAGFALLEWKADRIGGVQVMATVPRPRALPIVAGAIDESSAVEFVIGRRALVAGLWSTLESNHVYVTGERHVGKTWFLKLAVARPPNWALPAYVDATNCATPEQLVTRMCAALHGAKLLAPDWFGRVQRWNSLIQSSSQQVPPAEPLAPWPRVFRAGLVQAVRRAGNRKPVVIFDGLDAGLSRWNDGAVADLFQALAAICKDSDAVRFVLCGAKYGDDTLTSKGRVSFAAFHVPPLERSDARYLAACLLLGEQVACSDLEAVAEAVAELSGENPYLIRTTVDWMVRFGNGAWTPDRVREVPTALWFDVAGDDANPRFSDEVIPGGHQDDTIIKCDRATDRSGNAETLLDAAAVPEASERTASRRVLSLPPAFQLLNAPKKPRAAAACEPAGKNLLGKITSLRDDAMALPLRRVADAILNGIEESLREGISHRVVVAGPMGSGKSHVLRHLATALRGSLRDSGVRLIELPNASSPPATHDLPAECLRAVGATCDHLTALRPEHASTVGGKKAAALFRALTNESRIIVIADLCDDLWHFLRKDAMPNLLAFLEHAPEVSLIHASRVSVSKQSILGPLARHRIHAHYLRPLTVEESLAFMRSRLRATLGETAAAPWLGDAALPALRTLHAVTCGNAGWLNAIVDAIKPESGFDISNAIEAAGQRLFESGLKDCLDRLADSGRSVLNALVCEAGGPLSADAVAKRAGLTRGATLMELDRLIQVDLVLRREGTTEPTFELRDAALEGALARCAGEPERLMSTLHVVKEWYESGAQATRNLSLCVPPAAFSYLGTADDDEVSENEPPAFVELNPGSPGASVRDALTEARRQLLALDDTCTATTPRTEEAWIARGNALVAQGRFGDALAAYEAGALARPRHGERSETGFMALLNKGYTLDLTGRAADAIELYDELARRHSGSEREAIALVNKSGALIALERHREAAAACNEVLSLLRPGDDPFLAELTAAARFNLGCALHALGRDGEALAAYDDVVRRCAPSSCNHVRALAADAFNNIAAIYSRQADHADAIDACDAALRLHPAHTRAHIQRICSYLRLDLVGEALAALADAVRALPKTGSEPRFLAAEVLACASSSGALTPIVVAALGHDPRLLSAGVALWLRQTVRGAPGTPQPTAHAYYVLRQSLDSSPHARPALELFRECAIRSGAAVAAHRNAPPVVRFLLDECTARHQQKLNRTD